MPIKKNEEPKEKIKTQETEKVEQDEVRVEADPLEDQETDTPEKRSYRAMLRRYKEQNPVKYELKKGEFLKKLEGTITSVTKRNQKGVTRTTFTVPNIQSKRQ
jgi:hypothetical protein